MCPTSEPDLARRTDTIRAAAAYLRDWAFFQAAHRQAVGVQLAVRSGGEVVLDDAWGLADATTGEALRTDHLFRIASHSKTFTATAVMQLVEQGRLRLDDPVGAHVPELVDSGSTIAGRTVRELLGHQGGVLRDGRDADFWSLAGPFPDRAMLLADVTEAGEVYPANQHFKYSNVAYGLLGLVIEAVTGTGYAEHLHTAVVEPLGLTRTGADLDPARAADYAAGHTALLDGEDHRETIEHVDTRALAAATGFYSTARDLTEYGSAHFLGDTRLLQDSSKRVMQRLESVVEDHGTEHGRYGVGLDMTTIGKRTVVGHSGGYPGHITRTYLDPTDQLVVSALTNSLDGPAETLATGVITLIDLALTPPENPHGPRPGSDGLPPASAYTGRFAALWGVSDIVELGGRLILIRPGVPDVAMAYTELEVVGPDELRARAGAGFGATGEPVIIDRAPDGTVRSIRAGGMSSLPITTFRANRTALTRLRPAAAFQQARGSGANLG